MWPEVENSRWRPLHFQNIYLSLYTRYQRNSNGYTYVFGIQLSNEDGQMLYDQTRRNRKWKSKMAAIKLEVLISQLVRKIGTRFQRLNQCFPESIQFKLAVLVHRILHGNAPEYLGPFTRLSDVPSRSSLRSSSSNHLLVPPVCRSTVGARAFQVAGPALWNRLPADITSIDSLPVFRRRKNYLISHSYPGAVQ